MSLPTTRVSPALPALGCSKRALAPAPMPRRYPLGMAFALLVTVIEEPVVLTRVLPPAGWLQTPSAVEL